MLGLSKGFVIALAIAGVVGYGTHSWNNFFVIMLIFIIVKIVYNFLTK